MDCILLAIGIGLILYAVYQWATSNNNYWATKQIKYLRPYLFVGNAGGLLTNRYSLTDYAIHLYNCFPTEKVYGYFFFRKPLLFIRDPEILKQITVKDFDHFENHREFVDERSDRLFGNSLFLMRDAKWRDMRATLSPAFTGSKMRQMFKLVGDTAAEMVQHLREKTDRGEEVHAEMKELFSKFTNDVIASTAFGVTVNSFRDPKNEFFTAGSRMIDFTGVKTVLKLLLVQISPRLMQLLGIQFLNESASTFFRSLVEDTMEQRRRQQIERPDMINTMMQLQGGKSIDDGGAHSKPSAEDEPTTMTNVEGFATVQESSVGRATVRRQWNDDELIAQCFLFFIAGFETVSTALIFTAYELMRNEAVQERLYVEVAETNRRLAGARITYDELQRMQYMDQVVSEVLRMWPPSPVTDRECSRDYKFSTGDGNDFLLEKGTACWIPIYAFHHDPQYFPEPSKFDPERFSDERKKNILAGTYMPFGIGPRNCIGSRFALMEIKAVIYYLLLNFKFVPNAKTEIPVKLAKTAVGLKTERGVHLQLLPR